MANSVVDAFKNSMTKNNKTDNKDNEFGEN